MKLCSFETICRTVFVRIWKSFHKNNVERMLLLESMLLWW